MKIALTPELAQMLGEVLNQRLHDDVELRRIECPDEDNIQVNLNGRNIRLELNDEVDPKHVVHDALMQILRIVAKDPGVKEGAAPARAPRRR